MINKKRATVPLSSAATEEGQPSDKINCIISNDKENVKFSCMDRLKTISMTEMFDTVYPPNIAIVDGLLYRDCYLFAGAPKVGKSFFMAQLGYHVAKGLPLWGHAVRQGEVLYLALEDDYSRIQKRLFAMYGEDAADTFHFATEANTLQKGLDAQLQTFLEEHPDTELVIIDTLKKVREVGGGNYSYSDDYDIIAKLKNFSDKYKLCLLIVHHTRKMESEDSFDMISGTQGLLAAADGGIMMYKKTRTSLEATLEITGRDQPDQKMILERDIKTCVWNLKSVETEPWKLPDDPLMDAIAALLTKEKPEWAGTSSELLEKLPDFDMKPHILTRRLNCLCGRLMEEFDIEYSWSRTRDKRTISLKLLSKEK